MKNICTLFKSNFLITKIPYIPMYHAHDTLYIYKYRNAPTKKLIIEAKNGKPDALTLIAKVIHASIHIHIQHEPSYDPYFPILVLHAPSSSFALANKQVDHMAIALNLLSDIQSAYDKRFRKSSHTKVKIDIAPYVFMHSKPPLVSQHHKNRLSRLENTKDRFCIAYDIPYYLLSQYRYIYIVDDVLTTGSTLQALKQILSTYCLRHNIYPTIYTLAICH
ncbi:MAG: hypothetical protein RIQ72_166 [Candidatus Parcubacteria bacterium]|jgi:predicted amidophosphoribosyltransferase